MNKPENVLFKALTDLKGLLPNLVLVGGWVPYVYGQYIWKDVIVQPHHTIDIDFGVRQDPEQTGETVYERLTGLGYSEKHVQMDRLFPIVPLINVHKGMPPLPLEFLCDEKAPLEKIHKVTGKQIKVDQLAYFNILLSDVTTAKIDVKATVVEVNIPSESIFIFHKLITFQERKDIQKIAKDIYYAYYMLRFSPNIRTILADFKKYHNLPEWQLVAKGLFDHFSAPHSKGVLLVESEFGADSIVSNLRQHIFETFEQLK